MTRRLAATLALAGLPATVAAQPAAPGMEAARALARSTCAACHGADGVGVGDRIPNLAAQNASYLAGQLEAFRDGSRKSDVMGPIAKALDPATIPGLAMHFAAMPGARPGARSLPLASLATRAAFPQEYPAGMTRYHSVDSPETGRVTLYLANAAAVEAARAGKALPPGSVVMTATHEAARDEKGAWRRDDKGGLAAGRPIAFAVMASGAGWGDAVPELLRNGDWHYAQFDGQKRPRPGANQAECLACHKPEAATGYVFTLGKLAGK